MNIATGSTNAVTGSMNAATGSMNAATGLIFYAGHEETLHRPPECFALQGVCAHPNSNADSPQELSLCQFGCLEQA